MNADCPVSMKSTNWSAGETPTGQLLPPKMVQVLVKVLLLGGFIHFSCWWRVILIDAYIPRLEHQCSPTNRAPRPM